MRRQLDFEVARLIADSRKAVETSRRILAQSRRDLETLRAEIEESRRALEAAQRVRSGLGLQPRRRPHAEAAGRAFIASPAPPCQEEVRLVRLMP